MQHVFIINAHTPYLTALGILEAKAIDKKDVVFILGRNYKCFNASDQISTYDLSHLYDYRFKWNNKRSLLSKQKISKKNTISICLI